MIRVAADNRESLRLRWDSARLNITMDHDGHAVMTHGMVKEYRNLQSGFADKPSSAPDWMVVSSNHGDDFCYGGDAKLLVSCVREKDRESLHDYAHDCIDMLLDNICGCQSDVITIGVVDGDAFGLGLEAAMSFDYLVATPRSRFGFPDSEYGLFPGMGAQMFLSRKIGMASAKRMINEGAIEKASAMADYGIVTHMAESGNIDSIVDAIIERNEPRRASIIAARRAMSRACPIGESELRDIVDIWIDNVMNTSEENLDRIEGIMRQRAECNAR